MKKLRLIAMALAIAAALSSCDFIAQFMNPPVLPPHEHESDTHQPVIPPASDTSSTETPDTGIPGTDSNDTNVPDTDPPGTNPPDTDPVVTDPPTTDPVVTDPPATDPPTTDPPATDPPGTDPDPHAHTFTDWALTSPATCEGAGEEKRTCTTCPAVETRPVAPTGHTFGTWTLTTAPGCETEGIETLACTGCTKTQTRSVEPTGHTFSAWTQTKAPTADEEGEEKRTCAGCGKTESRPLPTIDHTFTAWVTTKAPSCGKAGEESRTCSNCGKKETRPLDALTHSYSAWKVTTKPSCEDTGAETRTCAHCGKTESRTIDATGSHTFGAYAQTQAPTCLVGGYEERTCSACGKTETRPVDPLGHGFSAWITKTEASCHTPGTQTRSCSRCGKTETQSLPAIGFHTFGDWKVTTPATCMQFGYEARSCSRCGETETRTDYEYGDHAFTAWTQTAAPTCTEAGKETRSCPLCGKNELRTVAAIGSHLFGEWSTSIAPNHCQEGQSIRTCTRSGCGGYETKSIPGGDHGWSGWTVQKRACVVNGTESRHCFACGKVESRAIPAVGYHIYDGWTTVTPANGCLDGLERSTCAGCGVTAERAILGDESSHNWVSAGDAQLSCTVCGETKQGYLPPETPDQGFDRENFGQPTFIKTNLGTSGISFSISGTTLTAQGKLDIENLSRVGLWVGKLSVLSSDLIHNVSADGTFTATYDLSSVTSQQYVNLYYNRTGESSFTSYVWSALAIKPDGNGSFVFVYPESVLEHNLDLFSQPIDFNDINFEAFTPEVKALADQLCQGATSDYEKMQILHAWVAQNVYYDYDYLEGRKSELHYLPNDVLEHRYTVCEGYARLLEAMLLSQGIAAHRTICYGGQPVVDTNASNHVFVEAYSEEFGRWVLMDPTWDSGNDYEFGVKTAGQCTMLYFDIAPDYMSFTHKFLDREAFYW